MRTLYITNLKILFYLDRVYTTVEIIILYLLVKG
nr:MAG TPA: hypothetical protein [Caudoviricetes sp.]